MRAVVTGLGWLPWRPALVMAVVLFVAMLLMRRNERTRSASRVAGEIALILGLYAAWQKASGLDFGGLDGAYDAGRWLAEVEETLRWPSESWLQQLVLGHDWVIRLADTYYASLHVPVFVVTLAWVLFFHRRDWPFARTTTVLLTAACLLIQYKPVAPPRLIPELGIVDTASITGLSVYAAIPGANQFSAMPSIHIGWAAAVALFVIVSARSPWRWIILAYPLMTLWVVVVTGNHFIIDGVAAVVLLAGAVGITLAFPSQWPRRFADRMARRDGNGQGSVIGPLETGPPSPALTQWDGEP